MRKSFTEFLPRFSFKLENLGYSGLIQLSNILAPLATYPYLIKTLGLEDLGRVVFAQTIAGYLVLLIDLGFNISATRLVTEKRSHPRELSKVFSAVILVKGALFFLAMILAVSIYPYIAALQGHGALYFASLWSCAYAAFFAQWFFQGMEDFKWVAIPNITLKIISVFFIFLIVDDDSDALFVPVIFAIGAAVGLIQSLYVLRRRYHITFCVPDKRELAKVFFDALPMFAISSIGGLHVKSAKYFAGTFVGMPAVAVIDIAEKLHSVASIPLNVMSQVLFPNVVRSKNWKNVYRWLPIILIINIFTILVFIKFGPWFLGLIGNGDLADSNKTVILYLWLLPLSTFNCFLGILTLCALGRDSDFMKSSILGAALYFISIYGLYLAEKHLYFDFLIISTLMAEMFIALSNLFFICKFLIGKSACREVKVND